MILKKVLIANRGEIAVRIIRACKELGLKTVAVHSTADRDALHAKIADESICIGPGPSLKSYLSIPAIMSAAEISAADAIHPGYGFLSENAQFAEICKQHSLVFIGPNAKVIGDLGDKVRARNIAISAKVPLLPGSKDEVRDFSEAKKLAKKIGFPLIIKASAGGGGRGMKIVHDIDHLEDQFLLAQTEAEKAFNNRSVFIERYCQRSRHVEVQILADQQGNCIALGERDCTVQRRHQKLIEEAPCPVISDRQRKKLWKVATDLAKASNYDSVGTVEFLYDLDKKQFYFMEVNTRIQVEHPVTEEVCGIDLVKEMIRVASGGKLSIKQEDVRLNGHSIECRINAEDSKTFAPWPGKITDYHAPGGPGVRIDSMVYSGYTVPPLYDSMIAKLITHGKDREEALVRMRRCLDEMKVDGIRTNIEFHQDVLNHPEFISSEFDTSFLTVWKD